MASSWLLQQNGDDRQIIMGIFDTSEINEELIENIKDSNELESVMEVFAKSFPK